MSKNKTKTTKKVKVQGKQDYLNMTTGEVETFDVTRIEERDFNFHKVWMRNFISTLDIVGNKKTKLCMWIIDNINKENQLIGTLRSIAKDSNTSLETVRITLNLLMDADFLRRVQSGVYIVNPNIIFKGTKNARIGILNQYSTSEYVEISDQEKLENLLQSIESLQKKADLLKSKINEKEKSNEASSTPLQCVS